MSHMNTDHHWMQHALMLATRAQHEGEVPVGAVLVHENKLLAEGWNQVIQCHDPTAHAEIVALRAAGQQSLNYRLLDCTLYVTLEPCAMCMGAMIHARIKRVVFGAADPKTGVLGGAVNMTDLPHWNHQLDYQGGILSEKCAAQLRDFFKAKR